MKRTLLIIASFLPLIAIGQPTRLLLASDVYPPFTNVASQQRVALQLVNEALKRDGVTALSEIVDFSRVLAGIESGKYHGSAAIWTSEERQQQLIFSEPYLQNRLVLVGRKGSDVSATSFADLEGARVAVVSDYAYGQEVDGEVQVTFVPGESDQQNLRKLLAEEVDYILVDELLVQYLKIYHRQEIGQYLAVGATPLIIRPLHLALRRDIEQVASVIQNFNKRIQEMAADGTYNRILQVNWIQVDADGDGVLEYVLQGTSAGRTAPAAGYSLFAASGSSVAPATGSDRYVINGNVYKGWESVPGEYKVAPTSDESLNKLKILDFAVPKVKN